MFASTSPDFLKGHKSSVETGQLPETIKTEMQWRMSTQMFLSSPHSPDIHVRLQEGVDAVHYPAEQTPVQGLGHGVPHISGLVHSVSADNGLTPCYHTLGCEGLLQLLGADAQQRCSWMRRETTALHTGFIRLLQCQMKALSKSIFTLFQHCTT